MASLSANSSRFLPSVGPGKEHLPSAGRAPSGRNRKNLTKRLIVGGARRLHNVSFAFPALVKAFRGLQRLGINLTPNHFYWPVPDVSELEKREWPIRRVIPVQIRSESADGICPKTNFALWCGMPLFERT